MYKKMDPPPLFCEGAARAHFSWHMLGGGNAFDAFMPPVFKEMIKKYPAAEAPRMHQDFTRLNFGWWYYYGDTVQPDMYEYGTSRAAAWDCPITLTVELNLLRKSPRYEDVFEVLRRWEEARATNWLTESQKKQLKNLEQEHILLINEHI